MIHFKALIIFLVGILAFFGSWWLLSIDQSNNKAIEQKNNKASEQPTSTSQLKPDAKFQMPQSIPQEVQLTVPFISQSPFGQWDDPRQQDACEEASIITAAYWLKNQTFQSKQEGLDKILEASRLSREMFGTYVDTSAADTQKLLHAYTGHTNTELTYDFTSEDIKEALAAGNLVIVPTNGQKLNNPYFTGSGPERHMVVVIGYNNKTQQFTTNDVGTRQGKEFKYSYTTLMNAIADYPTGDHVPAANRGQAMIVVKK